MAPIGASQIERRLWEEAPAPARRTDLRTARHDSRPCGMTSDNSAYRKHALFLRPSGQFCGSIVAAWVIASWIEAGRTPDCAVLSTSASVTYRYLHAYRFGESFVPPVGRMQTAYLPSGEAKNSVTKQPCVLAWSSSALKQREYCSGVIASATRFERSTMIVDNSAYRKCALFIRSSHTAVPAVTAFSFWVMYCDNISKGAVPHRDGFRRFRSLKIR